ncbi:unnamed protein product [Closterium sp. NIES-64]|nr:unnamed protein product [Closterium sp. NIES-64]
MARLLFVVSFAVLLAVASAGQSVVTGPNNPPVNLDNAKGANGVATEVPPGIEKAAAAGGLDKYEGTTIVSTSTDSMLMVDVKVAGWNKMKCHKDLGKPGDGACTPANCSKGGIAAKWKTSNLLKNKLGVEVYVKGNPLTLKKASPQTCCNTCAGYAGCTYWQYIPDITIDGKKTEGACYLVHDNIDYTCGELTAQYATDSKPVHLQVRTGGECNPAGHIKDDPHLVGAFGTHFDFNGRPDKAFCLLTDKDLHVNMLLRGYYSDDTENAALVVDGKAVHTWIKELGIVWFANGADHKVRLAARSGKQQERGDGFMKTIEIDGEEIPRMNVGDEVTTEGGLILRFAALEKEGTYDVDYYTLVIDGLVTLDLRLRVANPKLQTPTEAEAHINVGIVEMEHTDDVHGVLGQTYRPDHAARAADFQKMIATLHRPISAESTEGAGFLDGTPPSSHLPARAPLASPRVVLSPHLVCSSRPPTRAPLSSSCVPLSPPHACPSKMREGLHLPSPHCLSSSRDSLFPHKPSVQALSPPVLHSGMWDAPLSSPPVLPSDRWGAPLSSPPVVHSNRAWCSSPLASRAPLWNVGRSSLLTSRAPL